MAKLSTIADCIRKQQVSGAGWDLDIDVDKIGDGELSMVLNNIAGFVEDGLTQGMNPFWKLTLNGGS